MGKATGFLEYERESDLSIAPDIRIQHFSEFHVPLDKEERCKQAGRCMNCGVPFCQATLSFGGMGSGCPLHNLIPEWQDEVWNGHWKQALSRLRKTNNFPEFTGRVCPAPCEASCTCGLNDTPVTVKENELAIIEEGYANGWVQPNIPLIRSDKRVAVIGSGPAGLAVADQLNQRGHNIVIFEREKHPGGLLMYGIPNMKLEKNIIDRRVKMMEAEGVLFRNDTNVGKDISAETLMSEFDAVVLCCGSKMPRDLNIPGRQTRNIVFAIDFLSAATNKVIGETAQFAVSAKDKNVVVVGGGDTGNDCVGTCIRQGCKTIVQLEMMDQLPYSRTEHNPWPQWPRICKTDYGQEESIHVFGHDPRVYKTTVKELLKDENGNLIAIKTVKLEKIKDEITGRDNYVEIVDSEASLPCELLLIAAGFIGCEDYVTKAFDVEKNSRGCISTASESYQTSNPKLFTAGDAHRGQSLVVWAIAEGRACAKEIDEFLMGYSNMI